MTLSQNPTLSQDPTLSQISVFSQQIIMFFIQNASSVVLFSINQLFNSKFTFEQFDSESKFAFFLLLKFERKKNFQKKSKKNRNSAHYKNDK